MGDLDTLRPEVADAVSALDETTCMTNPGLKWYATIRAELLRLQEEEIALSNLVQRQAKILTGVANALKGEPERLHSHSHHDLAEVAQSMATELAALKARIAEQPANPVDRSHEYVQSKEHGGCSECGYPEWEPWHRLALVKVED